MRPLARCRTCSPKVGFGFRTPTYRLRDVVSRQNMPFCGVLSVLLLHGGRVVQAEYCSKPLKPNHSLGDVLPKQNVPQGTCRPGRKCPRCSGAGSSRQSMVPFFCKPNHSLGDVLPRQNMPPGVWSGVQHTSNTRPTHVQHASNIRPTSVAESYFSLGEARFRDNW